MMTGGGTRIGRGGTRRGRGGTPRGIDSETGGDETGEREDTRTMGERGRESLGGEIAHDQDDHLLYIYYRS